MPAPWRLRSRGSTQPRLAGRGARLARNALAGFLLLAVQPADPVPKTEEPVPLDVSSFSALLQLLPGQAANDQLDALGRFGLGDGNDGADPERETVTFSLGPFSRVLPPGSFQRRTSGGITFWEYRERGGRGELVLRRQEDVWTFRAGFNRLGLAGLVNPVTFVLRIGNDEGRQIHYYGRHRLGQVEIWEYPPVLDQDADDDGVSRDAGDCNDQNPRIHPGAAEVCDGIDNDCDLQTDEGFSLGQPCTAGTGACLREGTTVCSAEGTGTVCNASPGLPSSEACNALDDDCDGSIDEDLGILTCGSGRCAATVPACVNGVPQVCAATDPAPEICGNGVDEDCNGSDLACPDMVLTFTAPANLATFNQTPIEIAGTVTGNVIEVTCADVPAGLGAGGAFTAQVPLREGRNTLTCMARDASGLAATASLRVTLDTTPPSLVLELPRNGLVTSAPAVTVMGTFNDVIGGAFDAPGVAVTCNGRPASVENRTFMLHDLPLRPGENAIRCTATDPSGNAGQSAEIRVVRQELAGQRIERISGDDQSAPVNAELPQPLAVRLVDASGNPVPGRTVTFQVTRGSGVLLDGTTETRQLAVPTNAAGQASVRFRLGSRAGAGDHRVTATALGFVGEVELMATATTGTPDRILAVGGEMQRAASGSSPPLPLMALVVDAQGNPVSGVPVTFEVVKGGGHLGGQPSRTLETGANGRVSAVWHLGPDDGVNNNVVTATFPGLTGLPASFVASGLRPGRPEDTRFTGIVLDNSNLPIPGATVSIRGTTLETTTDGQGRFELSNVPVGTLHLHIEADASPRPETFSALEFEVTTISGRENTLGMPILIPALDTTSARLCGGPTACVLQMANVPGMTLTVHPNSATFHDGSKQGEILFTQVHLDKVPMPPPDGSLLIPAWTIQPHGVHFDPPASVTIPNTAGLAPGERAEIFQFDHDLNEFVNIGMGTVSEDGSVVVSDPGYGITSAGWGGFRPPPPPPTCVSGCGPCKTCRNGTCVPVLGIPCSDGNSCTFNDSCTAGGLCVGFARGAGAGCNDGNPCTQGDTCTAISSCQGTPVSTVSCNDGDSCTVGDHCETGQCVPGPNRDSDLDFFVDALCGGSDCRDADPRVNPASSEGPPGDPTCSDSLDNNCNGQSDAADQACRSVCSNGIVEPGETCDPPGTTVGCPANQKCNPSCRCETTCGNGLVEPWEDCDFAIPSLSTGCCDRTSCRFSPEGTSCGPLNLCKNPPRSGVCDQTGHCLRHFPPQVDVKCPDDKNPCTLKFGCLPPTGVCAPAIPLLDGFACNKDGLPGACVNGVCLPGLKPDPNLPPLPLPSRPPLPGRLPGFPMSVQGRSVEVAPDGSFAIPNVPFSQTLMRTRTTVFNEGVSFVGQSGFLSAIAGGATEVGEISFTPVRPQPIGLRLGIPAVLGRVQVADTGGTLTATATSQLIADCLFPGGASSPCGTLAAGTTFRSSNSRICEVSAEGLVTARGSGTCLITAVNEGVIASVLIPIQVGGDGDSDSLPDDFESASPCLSPATADANADPDSDGRTSLQEFNSGTNPCVADTDGDGLSDGQETTVGSNPVLPDSDLDGLLDGQEPNPTGNGDGDGLINILDPDQDNDGLRDGIEVRICGNPTCASPTADNDADGLSNLDEVQLGTDPTRADTDGDGLSDSAEVLGGTDPINPDMDGDGFPDGFEVTLGSDPKNPTSVPTPPRVTEAVGRPFAVLNAAPPAPPASAEAVGRTFSLLNQAGPAPPTSLEAVGRTFSLLNSSPPAAPASLEAVSRTFSLLNQAGPPPPSSLEAVGRLFSVQNTAPP